MKRTMIALIVAMLLVGGLGCQGQPTATKTPNADDAQQQSATTNQSPKGSGENPADANTLRIQLEKPVWACQIAELNAEGTGTITFPFITLPYLADENFFPKPGFYMAILRPEEEGDSPWRLVQMKISRSHIGGARSIKVGAEAAARLKKGDAATLSPLEGEALKNAQSLPSFLKIDDSPFTDFITSKENIQRVAKAIYTYYDYNHRIPTAVLRGPDGAPWHSWRVLILPHLNEKSLFDEYKWDEPWDGPNNKKLIARMPDVYRDPRQKKRDGTNEDGYTNYAVAVGEGTAFTLEGQKLASVPDRILSAEGPLITIGMIKDGCRYSVAVGAVGAEAKIPWTKPQDVIVDKEAVLIGKGGFAPQFETDHGPAGLFGFFDSWPHLVPANIKPDALRKLLTIADGGFVTEDHLPGILSGGSLPSAVLVVDKNHSPPIAHIEGALNLPEPDKKERAIILRLEQRIAPFADARVVFHSESGKNKTVSPNEKGVYLTELPLGKYRVTLQPLVENQPFSQLGVDPRLEKPETTNRQFVVTRDEKTDFAFSVDK